MYHAAETACTIEVRPKDERERRKIAHFQDLSNPLSFDPDSHCSQISTSPTCIPLFLFLLQRLRSETPQFLQVGRVAKATPVLVSKAVEILIAELVRHLALLPIRFGGLACQLQFHGAFMHNYD